MINELTPVTKNEKEECFNYDDTRVFV